VFDLNTNEQLIQVSATNNEIIGRFVSGLYTLIDGYFYYGNSVIKIRYDLLKNKMINDLNE